MSGEHWSEDAHFYEVSEDRWGWRRFLVLLIGLAIGLAAGLVYTWLLYPVEFYNTEPVDLHPGHQDTWIMLVSAAYRLDGDLERANARLAELQEPQIGQRVAQLTQRYIAQGKPVSRIRALALLADALGARTPDMLAYLATPQPNPSPVPASPTATAPPSPSPSPTAPPSPSVTARAASETPAPQRSPSPEPAATRTPRPTRTLRPTSTPIPPYLLQERQRLCRGSQEQPQIEVFVQTEVGVGIPGVEIWLTWSGGAERIVTGLKPEVGLGYADFVMQPETSYAVAVGDPSLQLVQGLMIESCLARQGDTPLTSWRLIFVSNQPQPTVTEAPQTTPTEAPQATATEAPE